MSEIKPILRNETPIISSVLDKDGREIFEQTPIETPLIIDRPIPLSVRLRSQILEVNRLMREQNEYDTPEEADDFDVDDGTEFNSQYEVDFDHMNDSATSSRILANEEAEKGTSLDSATNVTPVVSSPEADAEG